MEPKKYEYIDSLRGLAILLVIMVHTLLSLTNEYSFYNGSIKAFMINGQFGVQLFFIVSAFTLMLSYQNRKTEKHRTAKFFIRRFFRIAPMYYLAIILILLDNLLNLNFYKIDHQSYTIVEIISNFLFVNGFFPEYINRLVPGGWSITVEFTFYMVLPFLCIKIKSLNSAIILAVGALLFSTAFTMVLEKFMMDDPTSFLKLNFISQLPVFCLGILAFWILKEDKNKEIKPISVLLLALAVFIYCYRTIPYHFFYSMAFFLLLITLSKKQYRIFSNKIMANIGKVSYSMYLIHFIFVGLVVKYGSHILPDITGTGMALVKFVIVYFIIFICSYIVSQFTYQLIETKGQNLGRKLIKSLDN